MLHPRLIKLEVVAEVYLGPCQMSMMNPNYSHKTAPSQFFDTVLTAKIGTQKSPPIQPKL